MTTPATPESLAQFDHPPPLDAILAAWTQPGTHPESHWRRRNRVREVMPELADALDRAAELVEQQGERPVPWRDEGSGQP